MSPSVMEDSVFIPSGASSLESQLRTEASVISSVIDEVFMGHSFHIRRAHFPLSALESSLTFYLLELSAR